MSEYNYISACREFKKNVFISRRLEIPFIIGIYILFILV